MDEPKQISPDFRSGYVALIGEPNVGKSTLLNSVLGQKISIVTPKPQTTRHKLLGILSTDEFQIVFLDTPGIILARYALQEAMMQSAASALAEADVILFLVDASRRPGSSDDSSEALKRLAGVNLPIYLALNKCDLVAPAALAPVRDFYAARLSFKKLFMISALKSEGTGDLVEALSGELPVHPPYYPPDQISSHHQRFFVAEMIREQIFLKTHEEIPYSTTVDIVDFKERDSGKWFISADVYVERDSQKGILIGKKGAMLKNIGGLARKEIEKFVEHPVFLDLHVKVREHWREKPEWLKRLGYQ
jgi:GTP-binding protein Era